MSADRRPSLRSGQAKAEEDEKRKKEDKINEVKWI